MLRKVRNYPANRIPNDLREVCIIVIRAQIFNKKKYSDIFFHARAKMLSFKIMLRLKCSDESKSLHENKCSDKNPQLKKRCSDENYQL